MGRISGHLRGASDDQWPATRWTLVAALDGHVAAGGETAWVHLTGRYRAPMEAYAQALLSRWRRRPCAADEAAEVVQDFVARAFEKHWLSRADPHAGRFRAYVQVLLRRFLAGRLEHDVARKRSPGEGRGVVSLHDLPTPAEPAADEHEDLEAFDREWVRTAADRARARLSAANPRYLELIDDLIATDGVGSADLPARLGVRADQLRVLRHRARRGFQKLLREELASTVASPEDFEAEWRALGPYMP